MCLRLLRPLWRAPVTSPDAVFQADVSRNPGIDQITDVTGRLLINGESRPLQILQTGQTFGTYRYVGPVPHDGEARYRFVIRFKRRFIFTSSGETVGPPDRYIVRPVGRLTWTSDHESAPLNDTQIDPVFFGPRRIVHIFDGLQPGFAGPLTYTARLTLHNGNPGAIAIEQPTLTPRSGGSVAGLTIRQSSGSTVYPVNVSTGATLDFLLTVQGTATGTSISPSHLFANIAFPYSDGTRTCTLGPIWTNVDIFYNPP